jgi:hypothetical protein
LEENAMIELTHEQAAAVEQGEAPVLLNPTTREEFVLVRKEVYDKMRRFMAPLNRGWDDPALDVYEQYRKKPGIEAKSCSWTGSTAIEPAANSGQRSSCRPTFSTD